jgi:tetratricopeptide (TPR) repeat protein
MLHAQIVEVMEALSDDQVAEQIEKLAHHAFRGEMWHKALSYCRQAGAKAMARSAQREAVGYFEQALTALAHLPENRQTCEQAIDLRFALRTAILPSGDFTRILAYLREAESLANVPQAISVLKEALDICQGLNLPTYIPWICRSLGVAYTRTGRLIETMALFEQASQQAETVGFRLDDAPRLIGLGEAQTCAQRALDHARAHGERGYEAWATHLLGTIQADYDPPDAEAAETAYRQALTLANELGMGPLQAHCHRGLGTLYNQTGQPEQARAELFTAIDMYRDMEMTFWLPETEAALAEAERKT